MNNDSIAVGLVLGFLFGVIITLFTSALYNNNYETKVQELENINSYCVGIGSTTKEFDKTYVFCENGASFIRKDQK